MVDWIFENIKWLFSGLGVVVLAAFLRLFPRLLKYRRNAKIFSLFHPIPYSRMTPSSILESAAHVPAAQKPDILSNFRGLRINWVAVLESVSYAGRKAHLILSSREDGSLNAFSILTTISRRTLIGMPWLKQGVLVRATGFIDEIDDRLISIIRPELFPYDSKE